MKLNKKQLISMPIFSLTLFLALQNIAVAPTENSTAISVNPSKLQLNTISTFIINITVSNVTDLSAWQIKLTFNPSIIQCTNITIPEQNIFAGHETTGLSYTLDNQLGYVTAFNGIWEPTGVNGSGILCQLTFKATNTGITSLTFLDPMKMTGTYLTDSENNIIPTETNNGLIIIAPEGFNTYQYNIETATGTYQVTILTNSSVTDFNYNDTLEKIEFTLNGTNGTAGSCSITIPKQLLNGTFAVLINNQATIFTCSDDQNNSYLCFNYHHSLLNIQVLTTLLGDLNGDRVIDGIDLAITAKAFGSYPNHPRWNPLADLNKDLQVDGIDLAIVARKFGEEWNQ